MEFNMVIGELLARDSTAVMLLLAAYLGDDLCYEFFCEGIPYENYLVLREALDTKYAFRLAMKRSGVMEKGVRRYIRTALDDYNMFYHFLDGISSILSDAELTYKIPIQDRNLIRSLFRMWKNGCLNERNWDVHLETLRRSA